MSLSYYVYISDSKVDMLLPQIDPGFGAKRQMRELIPPVHPVLELRWRSATPAQRKAFVKNLKDARKSGSRSDPRWNYRLGGIEVEVPR